jgi:TfoX/Sxy family transcriptional regulator of competence genes
MQAEVSLLQESGGLSRPDPHLMSYDSGLVERVDDALRTLGERAVRQKNVFGGRGFLVGKSTFVIVFDDNLIVKTPADEYDAALASSGVTPFAPDGESAMGTWVVVSGETIADDPELSEWVGRGLRAVRK